MSTYLPKATRSERIGQWLEVHAGGDEFLRAMRFRLQTQGYLTEGQMKAVESNMARRKRYAHTDNEGTN